MLMTAEFDPIQVIAQVTEQLQAKFPDRSPGDIRTVVTEEVTALQQRPVKDYVAVLSTRAATKRLKHSS